MKRNRSPQRDIHLDDLIAGLSGQRVRRSSLSPGAPQRKQPEPDRFIRRVRLTAIVLLGLAVAGAIAFVLVRGGAGGQKADAMEAPASSGVPLEQWSREHTAGTEAAGCLDRVLSGKDNPLEHLRPVEGIEERLTPHRQELAALGKLTRTIGGVRLVKNTYVALPVAFKDHGTRLAWFERNPEGRWLLDLDSFLGLSEIPISALASSRTDEPVLLRGISRPSGGKPAEALALRTPDGSATVKIWLDEFMRTEPGLMATLRREESSAMMLVSRLDPPVDGCHWKVDRLLGKEWFLPVDRRTNKTASSR